MYKRQRFIWIAIFVTLVSTQTSLAGTPIGLEFDISTLKREGHIGDNWSQTWAADDTVITAMDDGAWTENSGPPIFHSMLYKITGEPETFTKERVEGYPYYDRPGDGWFAYGIISVEGVLYSTISKTQGANWAPGPFRGIKLLRSYDSGDTWHRVDKNNQDLFLDNSNSSAARTARELLTDDEMFFFEESERFGKGRNAPPFGSVEFVQNGRDNSAAPDSYVYIYSPEGATAHELLLARVPASELGLRSAWEYFSGWDNGAAQWSSNIEDRQPNLVLPEKNDNDEYFGWYSWLPSVVWNPGLQLYVMANGGTYAGYGFTQSTEDYYNRWMHTKTGSLGLWYSKTPYGPWNQFFYTDHWTVDDPDNLTYQPKLSPKWISEDGQTMTLIWSDAMLNDQGDSHAVNYLWNQIEINIIVEENVADTIVPHAEATSPTNDSAITSGVIDISGIATDEDSDVNTVLVRVQRTGVTPNLYWSENGWLPSSSWLEASLDPNDSTWILPDVDLTVPADYRVIVRAFDSSGNQSSANDNPKTSFSVLPDDNIAPRAEATSPTNASVIASGVIDISGVATDDDSDISKVLVRVQRTGVTPALFWSENGWLPSSSWLEASLDSNDSTWILPGVDLTVPADYRVIVRAFDSSGNQSSANDNPKTSFSAIASQ